MSWKHAGSTVTGRSHADRGEHGQDYHRAGTLQITDTAYFIGLVADGAGSTTDGGRGAEIACGTVWSAIVESLRGALDPATFPDETVQGWAAAARDAICTEAAAAGRRPRDYACTLLGAVAAPAGAVFFQIGDGAIVVRAAEEYATIFWPEQGEYANTTFFLSDEEYAEHLMIHRSETAPREIALFTDGLQTLALSFAVKKAHPGFFQPLFDAVRKDPGNDFSTISRQLDRFLLRDDVSARSDDDKTLVLAVRV